MLKSTLDMERQGLRFPDSLFYKTLNERSGLNINDKQALLKEIEALSKMKKEYQKVAYALGEVDRKGYGIVYPSIDELTLDEPEIIKQGSRFGVRLNIVLSNSFSNANICSYDKS